MDDREAHEFYKDPAHLAIAGPARKHQSPAKTAMVAVRFDPAVIEAVMRLTEGTGTTVSSWIRAAVQREEYRQRVKWLDEHSHELEAVPGSGRACAPRSVPSSLDLGAPRTFSCQHMSIGGVQGASCGICGPLPAAA